MKSKLKSKIDAFLWAFMWLVPVLAFFVSYFRIGNAPELLTFIDQQFSFAFIADILNNIWVAAFGTTLPIAGYISYLVCIEIVHCLFDVVVLIPRIAHALVDKCSDFAGGK